MSVIFYVVVHSENYSNYFFDIQVPSIVNQNNYLDIKKYFIFHIYTKKEWLDKPVFQKKLENLRSLLNIEIFLLPDLPQEQGFENRYKYLVLSDAHANSVARSKNALLMPATATFVFGSNYFESALNNINKGENDAVLTLPPRALGECFKEWFTGKPLDGNSLFEYFKTYTAPIIIASEWDQPFGSREHFFLSWYYENQLILRSYGYTAVILKPYTIPDTLRQLTSDTVLLDVLLKPYISTDFHEFPALNLMMLDRYYHFRPKIPHLAGVKKTIGEVSDWLVHTALIANKTPNALFTMLNTHVIYKFSYEIANQVMLDKSLSVAAEIKSYIKHKYNVKWL
jgi:hypothetical protein